MEVETRVATERLDDLEAKLGFFGERKLGNKTVEGRLLDIEAKLEKFMPESITQGVLEAPGESRMSKTKATAMVTAVAGAIYAISAYAGRPIPIPQDVAIGVGMSLLALGQYFLRRAIL